MNKAQRPIMGTELTTSSLEEVDSLADLLRASFHVPPDAPFLNRSYMKWKYHDQGPSWTGSRSYVLREGNQLIAHATVFPVQLSLQSGVRNGIGFGDWVASEDHRGVGLLLLRRLMKLSSFVLVTGGAQITREILPRMGFAHWADRTRYARVLRPVRQALTRRDKLGWKEPLRLARNAGWHFSRQVSERDWVAQETAVDDQVLAVVGSQPGSVQTAEFLRYMLTCPTVKFTFLALRQGGKLKGYCLFNLVGGQARIADLRIDAERDGDWSAAVGAVVAVIQKNTRACELMAVGSVQWLNDAFLANGFRARGRIPLVVFDQSGELVREPVPQLGMLEDDSSVVYDPEFLT